jgi:hypothetical protein
MNGVFREQERLTRTDLVPLWAPTVKIEFPVLKLTPTDSERRQKSQVPNGISPQKDFEERG